MTDEDLKKIGKVIDDKFEEKFIKLFNQGFEQVISPRFDDIDAELRRIGKRLDRSENQAALTDEQIKELEKRVSL